MSTLQTTFIQKLGAGTDAFEIPANDGTSGQYLQTDGTGGLSWQTVPNNGFESYAIIADEKAYNVRGGTFTSGAWRTRDLNTEIADPDGIVSISSNEFTLAAGSYLIKWSAVAFRVHNHQTRLYDVTGTAQIQPGSSGLSGSADTMNNPSSGSARVTISANNTYRIEHRCNTTSTNQGFGEYVNLVADTNNVYTLVEIYKEA